MPAPPDQPKSEAGSKSPDVKQPEPKHDGVDAGSATPAKADVPAIARHLAEAVCAALLDCLGQQGLTSFIGREPCTTRFAQALEQDDLGSLQDSIDRGHVAIDASKLEDCYRDTRELRCAVQTERLPGSCQVAIAGKVGSGDTCSIGADCADGNFCALGDCPRVCTPRRAAAEGCQRDEECVNGLICYDGRCKAPATEGQACAGGSGAVCPLGMTCMGSSTGVAGVCTRNAEIQVGDLGAVCNPTGRLCMEGLSCAFDGGSDFSCQAAVESSGLCHLALPSQCPIDEYCGAEDAASEGRCRKLPSDGQACVLGDECAPGHVCLPGAGDLAVCHRLSNLSEACTQHASCRSGYCAGGACAVRAVCM